MPLSDPRADGYSKTGPVSIAAIRFRWTVRRDELGEYYVDETIGESSMPVVSGPMSGDAAIRSATIARARCGRFRGAQERDERTSCGGKLVRKDASEV